jgi:6-pyruvoyltetrahydropterin/6-carboxytetrahydropterin synthase
MELTVEFGFSAAHHLNEAESRCRAVHGHDYRLLVTVSGAVNVPDGMVMDFHQLDRIVHSTVVQRLDTTELNRLLPCPTAERLVEWIGEQLVVVLPQLQTLVLYETPRYSVTWRRQR